MTHKPSEPCTVTYMVLQMKVHDYYTSHAPLPTKVEHVCCKHHVLPGYQDSIANNTTKKMQSSTNFQFFGRYTHANTKVYKSRIEVSYNCRGCKVLQMKSFNKPFINRVQIFYFCILLRMKIYFMWAILHI